MAESSVAVDQNDHRRDIQSDEEEAYLPILKCGKSFTYTILSFPVYSAELRHVYSFLKNSLPLRL